MIKYHVGHLDLMDRIDSEAATLQGIELAGNSCRGVGIRSGEHPAERLLRTSFHELHDEIVCPLLLARVRRGNNVTMVQLRGNFHFPLEPLNRAVIFADFR